jgi:hypothetical protein
VNLKDFTDSKYMKKEDVTEDGVILQIDYFGFEEFKDGTKKPWMKFTDVRYKPLLLNKSNMNRLIAMFKTSETKEMLGKALVVFSDPMVEFQGQIVGGTKVRPMTSKEAQEFFGNQEPRKSPQSDLPGTDRGQAGGHDDEPF